MTIRELANGILDLPYGGMFLLWFLVGMATMTIVGAIASHTMRRLKERP